ncbi:MAG TPA: cytochrome ubiquinol oxidase subunit I [Nitrospiraceae bacterium]|nr:cytochrome ubiquinol oxidase subunit I [Nitrospiraceae bacterium]
MTDLLAARGQMAMSLAFHIIFAAIGIAMPLMMTAAEWRWLKTKDPAYLSLAKRWAKGAAILFAVGAVSGTVLSFELGLLWPRFMERAGPIVGPLFALEGFAFFTEAIFLGIYLYGWSHLPPAVHITAGAIVAVSGVASAIAVTIANAWMNTPAGFGVSGDAPISAMTAMGNPHALHESLHVVLASFAATGLFVAGIHAFLILRGARGPFHRHALGLALLVGGIPAVLQPLSGDLSAKEVARYQPAKLAAMEAVFKTESGAAFHLGGIPDEESQTVPYSLAIPRALSLLLYLDPQATVVGLDRTPRNDWPPVAVVHIAFQLMVGAGLIMTVLVLWAAWRWKQNRLYEDRRLLWGLVFGAPLGFIAIESGWVVTEVGRQPWIIHGVMRTSEAVTPMPGIIVPFILFTLLYGLLALVVVWTIWRHIAATAGREGADASHRLPEAEGAGVG